MRQLAKRLRHELHACEPLELLNADDSMSLSVTIIYKMLTSEYTNPIKLPDAYTLLNLVNLL